MDKKERLLKAQQIAIHKYLYAPKGVKEMRFKYLKNITKQLLKIEIREGKRHAAIKN